MVLRAAVGYTSVGIAIPPICFGHIDQGIRRLLPGFQSMILFSGYSTMPRAPACFSCGTMCRTTRSSMTVLTATQSGLTSVAPQLNSTGAVAPRSARQRRVRPQVIADAK